MKSLSSVMVALLSSTFLSAPAWAVDVNVDYLNSLTGPKISWSDSEGTEVTIGDKTFYYTYNMPDDYTETTTSVFISSGAEEDVTSKVFYAIDNYAAAANYSMNEDINIKSDFIENYLAIHNGYYSSVALGNIIGDFIGNSHSAIAINMSGVSTPEVAQIGDITGNFIGIPASDKTGKSSKVS